MMLDSFLTIRTLRQKKLNLHGSGVKMTFPFKADKSFSRLMKGFKNKKLLLIGFRYAKESNVDANRNCPELAYCKIGLGAV